MMLPTPSVFVFTCGSDYYGLSTQADGANLPGLPGCSHPWLALKVVALTEQALKPLATDVNNAVANLKIRGYHLSRSTALLPEFPMSGRRSA